MENQVKTTGIKKEFGQITVDEVKAHLFKSDRQQAQLRQVITSTYPGARANNSKVDSLFGDDDFGFKEGQSFEETRVTWIDVPLNKTEADVEAMLAKFPEARLQKYLSSSPILSDEQKFAVANGIQMKGGDFVTGDEVLAKIEQSQRVRNSEEELIDRNGEVIFEDADGNVAPEDQHRIQYKEIYFRNVAVEDVDTRERLNSERIRMSGTTSASEALEQIEANKAEKPF